MGCTGNISKRALEPVATEDENRDELILPAVMAKYLLEESDRKAFNEILNTHLSVLLPEVLIRPATLAKWSKFLKGKGGNVNEFSSLFVGARQRAITRFGKEAEELIYIKFNKDGGAAAEIIDHFGKEGLDALRKVDNIQDVAIILTKDKTMYRYLNETSYGFSEIKTTGVIQKAPQEYPIYITTEKYASGNVAKQKLQIPGNNDPTWIIDFNGSLVQHDIKFPMAKWNQQDYIEIICRSFPKQGEGGGIQFVTHSQFNIKRMTNLKTGEIINF